nr:unnamed protein product [Callosobruchus chinensis]
MKKQFAIFAVLLLLAAATCTAEEKGHATGPQTPALNKHVQTTADQKVKEEPALTENASAFRSDKYIM